MTNAADQPINGRAGLADPLFFLTTSRLGPAALPQARQVPFVAIWTASGGRFRSAGPRWFAVWGRDDDRMHRLRVLVLPAPWIGLSDDQMLAVLVSQLRRLQTGVPETPWLSKALAEAHHRLWHELSRGG